MLDSVYINRRLNLEVQNLNIHDASGTRDGPPKPRPLKIGKRFVPGFKRRRDATSSSAFYQSQSSSGSFQRWAGMESLMR
jgi:hypothetical protein